MKVYVKVIIPSFVVRFVLVVTRWNRFLSQWNARVTPPSNNAREPSRDPRFFSGLLCRVMLNVDAEVFTYSRRSPSSIDQ